MKRHERTDLIDEPFGCPKCSYNFETKNSDYKIMSTHYGQEITAMFTKNNIIGVQFHPEKSHKFGIKFLEAFLENEEF